MKIKSMYLAVLAAGVFGAAAQSAVAGSILLGQASGDIAVVYNCSTSGAACENPANVSYYRTQASETNTKGAFFEFSTAPIAQFAGQSFKQIFSGALPGQSQFGLDLVVNGAGSGSGTPAVAKPTLNALDHTTGNSFTTGAAIDWAINDYKPNTQGVNNPANFAQNSLFRGGNGNGSSVMSFSNLTVNGPLYTVDISGVLDSDDFIHWFNSALTDSSFVPSMFGVLGDLTGRILFDGRLTYNSALDTTAGVDFYAGNINLRLETVPEPGTLALLGLGMLGLVVRRRKVVA